MNNTGIKTYGDLKLYESNADPKKLDDYNSAVLQVVRLIYKQLPISIQDKQIFNTIPAPYISCFDCIKQKRIENLNRFNGITFNTFGTNFITDTGTGCSFEIGFSTIDHHSHFNKNMEKANFATIKQKQSFHFTSNSYYTEYFWQVNKEIIKPLEGFYKSSSVIESWNNICFNNGIVDGDSYKNFLEK